MKILTAALIGALVLAAICTDSTIAPYAWADDASDHHVPHSMMEVDDSHAHHHHMIKAETKRTVVDYELPQVKLVQEDGKIVSLAEELNDGRPVILDFIYTSCTEICPLTSRIFSMFQEELGSDRDKVHMVSISIDPEQDTPAVLKEYASKYGAGPSWHFYSGTAEASIATQQAFGVYRGNKMNHTPVTLLRAAPGKPWVRIDGFASADELLRTYRELVSSR